MYEHSVVCTMCYRWLKPYKNSVSVLQLSAAGTPHKAYQADMYICPRCGLKVLTGFGRPSYPGQKAFPGNYDYVLQGDA